MKKSNLMSSKSHQEMVILLYTAYAVCLGGEVKFNKFSDWMFDPRFNFTHNYWTEIKTTNIYLSPQVNCYEYDRSVDSYHVMGWYGALETGFISTQKRVTLCLRLCVT